MASFGYVRVSGDEQKRGGTSPELQKLRIQGQAGAQQLGEPVIFEDTESGAAGKEEERLQQKLLISSVRSGDTILITKVDRWSRDIVFGVQSVRDLVKKGVRFLSIDENIDAGTPQGDSMLGLMSWVADQERKRIVERTVGARQSLRAAGDYVEGNPPVGYMRAEKINGRRSDRKLHPSSEAPIVREMFQRCAAGESIRTIIKWLHVTYPRRRWDTNNVGTILASRIYLGKVEVKPGSGQWIDAHEALVDEATFLQAQRSKSERRIGGPGRKSDAECHASEWLLRGIANCALCGRRIGQAYAAIKPGHKCDSQIVRVRADGLRYRYYYACNGRIGRDRPNKCLLPHIRVERTDEQVNRLLRDHLLGLRHELTLPAPQPSAQEAPNFEAQVFKLATKRKRLTDAYENDLIQIGDFRVRVKDIDRQVAEVEHARADFMAANRAQDPACRADLLTQVENLERAFQAMTNQEKRQVLAMLASKITLDAEGTYPRTPVIKIEWHPLESLLTRRAA